MRTKWLAGWCLVVGLLGCSDETASGPATGAAGSTASGGNSGSSGQAQAGAAGVAAGSGGSTAGSGGVAAGGASGEAGAGSGGAPSGGQAGQPGAGSGGEAGSTAAGGQGGQAGSGGQAGGSSGGSGQGGMANEVPPVEAKALLAYLEAGLYKGMEHESAPHPSSGPHGQVQVYVNQTLAASLAKGSGEHPEGAAAVKELYQGGQVVGWAVEVKTQATSDNGAGWYWYEILDKNGSPLIGAKGPNFCSNCHGAGHDQVLIPYPLQ